MEKNWCQGDQFLAVVQVRDDNSLYWVIAMEVVRNDQIYYISTIKQDLLINKELEGEEKR